MVETLPSAAFFVSGGTVPLGAASYVPREADRVLLEALRERRYAYVLTSRQMGKSSLSVRTMEALREEGVRTAFVDLTRVGGRNVTAEQWYAGLLGEVGRGLGDRAALLATWKAHSELGPMQRFFGALREAVETPPSSASSSPPPTPSSSSGKSEPTSEDSRRGDEEGAPVVIFIDEIDATKSLPFSTDEFFAGIRECFNRRTQDDVMARLTFCLIGVAIPSDLMSDTKLTPFNVGERIVLRDFSLSESSALAAGLGPHGPALVARIHYWTGGHPFLTQSIGRRLAETDARTVEDVDRLVAEEFFEARARETNINLADVGNRVLNSYDDPEEIVRYRSDVLSLYDRVLKGRRLPDDESNRLIAVLKLAGLVKVEGGVLRVRNRIYARVFGADWVREHMPHQERRRQQRAFRRGMLRATAMGTVVCAALGGLGVAAVLNAEKANRALAQARRDRQRAIDLATQADAAREAASASAVEARLAQTNALAAKASALKLAKERADALEDARTQQRRADAQTLRAQKDEGIANEERTRADAAAKTAIANAVAAQKEKTRADAQAAVARDQSHQAYISGIRSADLALDGGRADLAAPILRSLRRSSWRGWEYDYLSARLPIGDAKERGDLSTVVVDRYPTTSNAVAVSGDGRFLASVNDSNLFLVDLATGRRRWVGDTKGWYLGVAFSPDGKWIAATDYATSVVNVFDAATGRAVDSVTGNYYVEFSPDGRFLVAGGRGTGGSLYDTRTWQPRQRVAIDQTVVGVAFAPDSRSFVTASMAGQVAQWSVADGSLVRNYVGSGYAAWAAFSPNGRRLATIGPSGTCVWDVGTGRQIAPLCSESVVGDAILFSNDGRRIVESVGEAKGKSILIRDGESGSLLVSIPLGKEAARTLAFGPDGGLYASLHSGEVRVYRPLDATGYARLAAAERRDDALAAARAKEYAERVAKASRTAPVSSKDRSGAASLLVEQGKLEQVVPIFDSILRTSPGDRDVRTDRTAVLGTLGRYAEAERDLRFLIAHPGNGGEPLREPYQLAVAVAAQGHEEAYHRLRSEILAAPHVGRTEATLQYLLMASAFAPPLDEPEAAVVATAVDDPNPTPSAGPASVWTAYSALALVRLGRNAEALERAERLKGLADVGPEISTIGHLAATLAAARLGDIGRARTEWEAARPLMLKIDEDVRKRRVKAPPWAFVVPYRKIRAEAEVALRAKP